MLSGIHLNPGVSKGEKDSWDSLARGLVPPTWSAAIQSDLVSKEQSGSYPKCRK